MSVFEEPIEFPPLSCATEDGLLMIGGKLAPNWVVAAYRQGIFPWPIVDHGYEILAWFSPDPRAVLELNQFHVSRRLARRIRSGRFQVTSDRDFAGVIAGCAAPRAPFGETWITADMIRAYRELHRQGHAHSVEVWREGTLVGGVYGVSIGAFFAGESMFYRERDASKVAIVFLVGHLKARGFQLFDVQQATAHVVRLGASEISRDNFLGRLHRAVNAPVDFGHGLDLSRISSMLRRS
ncbi:MAG: leucyl/phenylalanyl-tRNA--protein transferase [Planctomycetota bacterium]